jgi:hypothetical protein
MNRRFAQTAILAFLCSTPLAAQFKNGNQTVLLELPRVSQRCVLTQRIGLTDFTITYHRPQVKGRKIFGDVVPYDRVWRAGANDNTIFELTNDAQIEGQPLQAGRYGLHMIPGSSEWTVIFSNNSTSWGSFTYDPKEDALRVKVKPVEGAFRETMTFDFANLEQDSAIMSLAWERVVVPLRITVDTKSITVASLRNQMRHLAGFKPESYYEAALYSVDNDFNYEQALKWIDHAIAAEERFENLDLKSQILEHLGRLDEARETAAKALKIAEPDQLYGLGDRLLREKKTDDAYKLFTTVTRDHPDVWLPWYGLARVQVARGEKAAARKSLEQAVAAAPRPAQKNGMRRMIERLDAGQAID